MCFYVQRIALEGEMVFLIPLKIGEKNRDFSSEGETDFSHFCAVLI